MIDAPAQAAAPGMTKDQFMALIQQLVGGGNGAGQWAPGMSPPGFAPQRGAAGLFGGGLSQLGAAASPNQGSLGEYMMRRFEGEQPRGIIGSGSNFNRTGGGGW